MVYKWCIVPRCTSTSIKNPQKDFLTVPLNPKKRKMWLQLARRDPTSILPQSNVFMCEDHFDMRRVVANYMKYKMGFSRNFLLADDAMPTKFHCQEDRGLSDDESFPDTFHTKKKKRQNDTEMRSENIRPKKLPKPRKKDIITDLIIPLERIEPSSHAPQQLRVEENVREEIVVKVEILSENEEVIVKEEILSENEEIVIKDEMLSESDISCSESDLSTFDASSSTTDTASDSTDVTDHSIENIQRLQSLKNTMYYIEKRPMLYIGIPKELYFLIQLVNKHTHIKIKHILLCLKKIRMNCTFSELADNFGISSPHARRIFLRDIPILSSYLQKFIVISDSKLIKNSLPIAFNNYHVSCIIDYLEINIKKPLEVHYQALTWLDCEKGHTVKYLISCTPNGLISFLSKGFGGRTSDVDIVENSNFLDEVEMGTCILANRGFKDLEQILEAKGMTLVQPSVKADENLSNQILASLRINCKKVIRRLREFHMLRKHSMIDVNLQHVLDHVVIIACSLVNLQDSLIK